MAGSEPSQKIILYVGEDHTYRGRPAFMAILEYLVHKGARQVSATRGVAGFGADHHLHTTAIERLMENLPIRIEVIESSERVDKVMPILCQMVGTGLIEVQDTVVSVMGMKTSSHREETPTVRKRDAKAQLMRIFIDENDRWSGRPLYQALVDSMRANQISGVTVYQGVQGYGENHRIDRDQERLAFSDHPITVTVIESEDKIRAFLPFLEEMARGALIALSNVETIRYTHDFHSRERRSTLR